MAYGLTISGVTRVFRKDKEVEGVGKKKFVITDVWFNVSEKEDDGTYFNRSMNLLFKRDLPKPESNTLIELEGFPVITGSGNYRKIAIMVTAWAPAVLDEL